MRARYAGTVASETKIGTTAPKKLISVFRPTRLVAVLSHPRSWLGELVSSGGLAEVVSGDVKLCSWNRFVTTAACASRDGPDTRYPNLQQQRVPPCQASYGAALNGTLLLTVIAT